MSGQCRNVMYSKSKNKGNAERNTSSGNLREVAWQPNPRCGMLQGQKVEDLFARKPLAKDLEEQFGVFAWRFAFTAPAHQP